MMRCIFNIRVGINIVNKPPIFRIPFSTISHSYFTKFNKVSKKSPTEKKKIVLNIVIIEFSLVGDLD